MNVLTHKALFFSLVVIALSGFGCGKVAQDITAQSDQSIFKTAKFSINLESLDMDSWDALSVSGNSVMVYSYFEGVKLDSGTERIGWSSAFSLLEYNEVASKNQLTVTNYDSKKNIITASRHRQGFIRVNTVSTTNMMVNTEYKKVRPKYDFYILKQYMDKDDALFSVMDAIPTASVTITPYSHLVSMLFMTHMHQESYMKDSLIDFDLFEQIIPISVSDIDLTPTNNVARFDVVNPKFEYDDGTLQSLIHLISLVRYSDEVDALDYIDEQSETIFSVALKGQLKETVESYFSENPVLDEMIITSSVQIDE